MTKYNYIFVALTISIVLLSLMFACSFMISANSKAHADYIEDIVNNPQAIVNFNQLLHNSAARENVAAGLTFTYTGNGVVHVSGTYTNNYDSTYRFYATPYTFDMIENHIYYIYVGNVDTINYKLMVSSGDYAVRSLTERGTIYQSTSSRAMYIGTSVVVGNTYDFYASSYVIDLTTMFGSNDNVPNINQANDIFVADYYPYVESSAIVLSGLNSYAQGVSDTLGSMIAHYDASIIGDLAYPYNYNGVESEFYYDSRGYYIFSGYLAVPVGKIPSNSTINLTSSYVMGSGGNTAVFYYFNNELVQCSIAPIDYSNISYNSFSIPYEVDTLYIAFVGSNLQVDDSTAFIYNIDLEFKTLDTDILVKSAYRRGQKSIEDNFRAGTSAYDTIYNMGYNAGLNATATDFSNTYYTFPQFLGAIFDVPVQVVTSLLDFEVFGFNLKNFVFSIITLAIVFAIIRLILQKTGDSK